MMRLFGHDNLLRIAHVGLERLGSQPTICGSLGSTGEFCMNKSENICSVQQKVVSLLSLALVFGVTSTE